MVVQKKKPGPKKVPIILVTGVPGCGKTTLCQSWCEREGWIHFSLNEIVENEGLYSSIDEEDMSKVVRLPALEKAANEWMAKQVKPILVDGHLGCEVKLNVSKVLVLRLHPDELARRLLTRGYSPAKVQTNKMTELLDYCTVQATKNYGKAKVFELNVSKNTPAQTLAAFTPFMNSKKPSSKYNPHVDWSAELFKEVDVVQKMRQGQTN